MGGSNFPGGSQVIFRENEKLHNHCIKNNYSNLLYVHCNC